MVANWWHLIVVLLYISLMINYSKQLYIALDLDIIDR